jgi:hypothetical protein
MAVLTLSIVISLFQTQILVNAVNVTNSSSTNSTDAFSTFENNDYHFEIQYPENWTRQVTGLVAHQFIRLYTTNPPAEFTVWARNMGKNFTLADYAKGVKEISNSTIDVVVPGKMITTGSGLKAFQQTYYDYSKNTNVKDMDTVIIDEKNGIGYMLIYKTEPSDFDINLPVIKKMIDSFLVIR